MVELKRKKLHNALIQHSICHFDKARNISPFYIIDSTTIATVFQTLTMDIFMLVKMVDFLVKRKKKTLIFFLLEIGKLLLKVKI